MKSKFITVETTTRQTIEELANEPLNKAPIKMEVADFERWTLKLAVQTIRSLSPRQRAKIAKRNPLVLFPDFLALHLKEQILHCMSETEYKSRRLPGYGSMWASSEFWFEKPVKRSSILRAAFEAGLVSKEE